MGEASNGIETVEMTLRLKPQVVIMDLIMPEKSGSEATAEILAELPDTRILLLTTFGTADEVAKALEAMRQRLKENAVEKLETEDKEKQS